MTQSKQVRSGRGPLVASAVENFTERGYHGTSMRDIAAGAGVTVASIYHHFSSKQEVLVHIMAGTLTDLLAATTAADAAADGTACGRLRAVVDAWVLFHTQRQAEALIGASEIRSLDGPGRDTVVGLRDEQEALFRGIVEDGVASGEFATRYPREAARAILNMGSTVSVWYRQGGELTPEEMSRRYIDFALGTVRAVGEGP
ncbi:TetR/AcrR family transcriptional regulator [Nocardioides sp. GY 10113]|uniref:TetR/AcrR family transcriptional regulator n=1 Tax=Nocardioides sp. GY 10113 TaxID=2569761 RepID=UPI0010A850A0|nr:TetR/AcrR family transcriptional regulator [Nocardioides sp. GY 10113]TIC88420.1 TetR/AcrR family transcriptional regulator [Nocardioides sp. GY 10113]